MIYCLELPVIEAIILVCPYVKNKAAGSETLSLVEFLLSLRPVGDVYRGLLLGLCLCDIIPRHKGGRWPQLLIVMFVRFHLLLWGFQVLFVNKLTSCDLFLTKDLPSRKDIFAVTADTL